MESYRSEESKRAIAAATAQGATTLLGKLLSSAAVMPSREELEAELGRDFFEQTGDAIVIRDPNNSATS
ncbi:MAG: hypothetical protein NT159_01395 [Proteobacteria bacterium]|nr:hypothetical protein [Pseudomonadota bacterium]